MVMGLESFMESYNRNVVIHGSDEDYATMFEGVEPCTYEEAIETFFEAQYSVEAMAAITENAIVMESAGAATVVNEGIIGGFVSAAWEKIKQCAIKVKQFAVACVKRVIQFFKDLYAKATPIDKAMQMYGKKPVSYSDIKNAMANGFKIPASLKILKADPDKTRDEIMKPFEYDVQSNGYVITGAAMLGKDMTDEQVEKGVNDTKEALAKHKEEDKEKFTWVGQLLSDNEEYTKKNQLKNFIRKANDDASKDGDIEPKEWDAISDYALNGQRKQRDYRSQIEKQAKDAIKLLDTLLKGINAAQPKVVKNASDDDKTEVANAKARISKLLTVLVATGTYSANRSVMVMNKVIIPVMRKLHTTAIGTYLYITANTKAKNRKTDKALKIK